MMAATASSSGPLSPAFPFCDFPEDVQLTVLSYLSHTEIASFAATSRRFASLCKQPKLWYSICDRRWGARTHIESWACGSTRSGEVPFLHLFKTLARWENLIGFWRRIGTGNPGMPSLVFFEWGSSYITGSWVSPSSETMSYDVHKKPFIWMGLSSDGREVCVIHPGGYHFESTNDLLELASKTDFCDPHLIPVSLCFAGNAHFVLEEDPSFFVDWCRGGDMEMLEVSVGKQEASPLNPWMSEMYQYFANRMSPGTLRRQRKKEKGRVMKRKWEKEHFVKIFEYCPTSSRPLQGLWKGICESMFLEFFLIIYDENGGISCRILGDPLHPPDLYRYQQSIFSTSDASSLKCPFSKEEEHIYDNRQRVRDVCSSTTMERDVSRVLKIYSTCNTLFNDASSCIIGRLWEYKGGNFGFGFLHNNFMIEVKHIALNGCLLDVIGHSNITYSS